MCLYHIYKQVNKLGIKTKKINYFAVVQYAQNVFKLNYEVLNLVGKYIKIYVMKLILYHRFDQNIKEETI